MNTDHRTTDGAVAASVDSGIDSRSALHINIPGSAGTSPDVPMESPHYDTYEGVPLLPLKVIDTESETVDDYSGRSFPSEESTPRALLDEAIQTVDEKKELLVCTSSQTPDIVEVTPKVNGDAADSVEISGSSLRDTPVELSQDEDDVNPQRRRFLQSKVKNRNTREGEVPIDIHDMSVMNPGSNAEETGNTDEVVSTTFRTYTTSYKVKGEDLPFTMVPNERPQQTDVPQTSTPATTTLHKSPEPSPPTAISIPVHYEEPTAPQRPTDKTDFTSPPKASESSLPTSSPPPGRRKISTKSGSQTRLSRSLTRSPMTTPGHSKTTAKSTRLDDVLTLESSGNYRPPKLKRMMEARSEQDSSYKKVPGVGSNPSLNGQPMSSAPSSSFSPASAMPEFLDQVFRYLYGEKYSDTISPKTKREQWMRIFNLLEPRHQSFILQKQREYELTHRTGVRSHETEGDRHSHTHQERVTNYRRTVEPSSHYSTESVTRSSGQPPAPPAPQPGPRVMTDVRRVLDEYRFKDELAADKMKFCPTPVGYPRERRQTESTSYRSASAPYEPTGYATGSSTRMVSRGTSMSVVAQPVEESREVVELRLFYEEQLTALRRQLQMQTGHRAADDQARSSLEFQCRVFESEMHTAKDEVMRLEQQVMALTGELNEWPDRVSQLEAEYQILQRRLEEMRVSEERKDRDMRALEDQVQQLEALVDRAGEHSREDNMLKYVLDDYDRLGREFDQLKIALASTEARAVDAVAAEEVSARTVSQLEIEIERLRAENLTLRQACDRAVRDSSRNGFLDETESRTTKSGHRKSQNFTSSSERINHMSSSERDVSRITRKSPIGAPSEALNGDLCPWGRMHRDSYSPERVTNGRGPRESSPQPIRRRGSPSPVRASPLRTSKSPPSRLDRLDKSSARDLTESTRANNHRSSPFTLDRTSPDKRAESRNGHTEAEVRQMETRYDDLQFAKRKLEAALSHVPSSSLSKNRRTALEERERLEGKLDRVDRELGSLRMTLKHLQVIPTLH